jgi:flavodoxin
MSRKLVAYFSHSGNTREIAGQIRAEVGGDEFEIQSEKPYSTDYDAVVKQAKQELESDLRPRLKVEMDDAGAYDTVFIGYPNWWGTIPRPVATFLTEYDLSGKTVVPFCTHEGSRLGQSVRDIRKLCPGSNVLEGLAVRGGEVRKARQDIARWIREIGVKEQITQ